MEYDNYCVFVIRGVKEDVFLMTQENLSHPKQFYSKFMANVTMSLFTLRQAEKLFDHSEN